MVSCTLQIFPSVNTLTVPVPGPDSDVAILRAARRKFVATGLFAPEDPTGLGGTVEPPEIYDENLCFKHEQWRFLGDFVGYTSKIIYMSLLGSAPQ